MNVFDFVILGMILILAAVVIVWLIHRRKQGQSSCGHCPYSGNCTGNECRLNENEGAGL